MVKKIDKKFLLTTFAYFLLSILFATISLKTIILYHYYKYNSFLYISSAIVLLILICIIAYKMYYKTKDISKIFLMVLIPIGSLYMIYMLPFFVPDEEAHIYRAYDISVGNFYTKKDKNDRTLTKVPKDIIKYQSSNKSYYNLEKSIEEKSDYKKNKTVNNKAASYFPLLYIFSSIGMLLGRLLNLNVIVSIYLSRMLNFILYAVSGYIMLKKIPFGKILLFTYLLSPMMFQQMTSTSADCIVNISCLSFIIVILNYKFNKVKLGNKEIAILLLLIAIIGLSKYVYLPLILLLFLLDKKELKRDGNWKKILIGIFIIIIFVLMWLMLAKYDVHYEYNLLNNVNEKEQLKYILTKPWSYLHVLYNTMIIKTEPYIITFVGRNLGYLNIIGNNIFIVIYIYILINSIFIEKHKYELSRKDKILSLIIVFCCYNLVLLGMYLLWTPLKGSVIEGVQGRYFIPFLIVLLFSFIDKKKFIKLKNTELVYCIFIILINYTSLFSILRFFL